MVVKYMWSIWSFTREWVRDFAAAFIRAQAAADFENATVWENSENTAAALVSPSLPKSGGLLRQAFDSLNDIKREENLVIMMLETIYAICQGLQIQLAIMVDRGQFSSPYLPILFWMMIGSWVHYQKEKPHILPQLNQNQHPPPPFQNRFPEVLI